MVGDRLNVRRKMVLLEFIKGGGSDAAELAACEARFEEVRGIHRTLARGTGADHGVHLVNKEDDAPFGV